MCLKLNPFGRHSGHSSHLGRYQSAMAIQKIFWNVTATLPPPRGRTASDDCPLSSMRKPLRRSA